MFVIFSSSLPLPSLLLRGFYDREKSSI